MIRLLLESVILLAISAVATWATFQFFPNYPPSLYIQMEPLREDEVTLADVEERWQGRVHWVDARVSEKYEKGHIPGAHSLNEQDYDQQILPLLELFQTDDRPIVVYCGSEKCQASRKIAAKDKLGMFPLKIYILRGGWPAWQEAHPGG